jgi:hypothetical protein
MVHRGPGNRSARKLARRGLVVVSLVALAVVGFAGTAGAAATAVDNPLVGTKHCTPSIPGSPPPTCTFTGTVNGVAYTGTLDDALLSWSTVRTCTPGDARIAYHDGTYVIFGGSGIFAGVKGYGYYSDTYASVIGFGSMFYEARFGGAASCGGTLPLPVFPPSIVAQSLPDATLGQPYTATLSADDGLPPYKWMLTPKIGKLPRGLKLNKVTGTISGTPRRLTGTFSFTVMIKDSQRPKRGASQQFSITVH